MSILAKLAGAIPASPLNPASPAPQSSGGTASPHAHAHSHSHGGAECNHSHGAQAPGQRAPQNFIEACASGSMGVCMAFWDEHSVHQRDQNGATPLHWAALQGHPHICRFLVDNGADKDAQDSQRQTALHYAATSCRAETVHALLQLGCDPMLRDSNNNTPHGSAAVNDALPALHVLYQHTRIAPETADAQGNTPLAWGAYKGQLDVVKYCHEVLGIPANTVGKFGRNPLHWAAREGHPDVCVYLLGLGLDPAAPDEGGYTPLKWAEERNHVEVAAALKAKQTKPIDRNVSTVRALLGSGEHMLRAVFIVAFLAACFFFLGLVPPIFLGTMLAGYLTKNTLVRVTRKTPVFSHKTADPIDEQLEMPKTMEEAFVGPKHLHRREPGAALAVPLIIIAQVATMLPAEGSLPFSIVWALLCAKIFAAATKALASRDVVPNGSVKDYPLLSAVDQGQWEDVDAADFIFDKEALIRKPARAFRCEQIGMVVRRFDSWSVLLDTPISHSNARWNLFFLCSLAAAQFFIVLAGWRAAMVRNGCANADEANMSEPAQAFSWCVAIPSLLLSATPCPAKHSWLGGVPLSKLTWGELIMGTEQTRIDTLHVLLPLLLLGLWFSYILKALQHAMSAASVAEGAFGRTPSSNGGLMSLRRAMGYGSVWGEGARFANLMQFLLGTDGDRWGDAPAYPAASRPRPEPHPLVLPPPEEHGVHKGLGGGGGGGKKGKRGQR